MRHEDNEHPIISQAISQLILGQPWYATLALRLRVRRNDKIPTACVDGVTLQYNEKWLASLPAYQTKAVIAHEVMHCALLHMTRRGGRNPMIWNLAGDNVINLELEAAGFKLPADCVKDKRFIGMGTEQVYAILRQEIKDVEVFVYVDGLGGVKDAPKEGEGGDGKGKKTGKKGGTVVVVSSGLGLPEDAKDKKAGGGKAGKRGDGASSGSGGGDEEDEDGDQGGADQAEGLDAGDLEHEWEIAAASASMVAQRAGHLPAGADRAVRAARSQTDWRETLQKYLVMAGDYSWTRPNRRHIGSGLYLPGSRVDRPGRVVIAVDTSGSINQQMLEKFAGEAKYILDAAGWPESVYLIYCDSIVQGAREVEQADGIDFSDMKGGGGTYAQPVFDHVREMGVEKGQREPVVLFYLTDLDLGDQPKDPGYPVVWVVPEWTYHQAGPFGEMVKVEMEGGRYGY